MEQPLLLRLVYKIVPQDLASKILPQNASFGRQAVAIGGVSFLVGASMEMFMIQTGFYEVATRKEAERRALQHWEYEEGERMRLEKQRERAIKAGGPEALKELQTMLQEMREKEQSHGLVMDKEKEKVKAKIRGLR